MKIKGPVFFSIVLIGLLVSAFYPQKTVDNAQKEAILIQSLLEGLNQLHYRPQSINDGFSQKVYDLYLDRLDPTRRWLTQKDVDQLKPFALQLDDEASRGSYEFFNLAIELYEAGFKKSQGYFEEILDKPFKFSKQETINLDLKKRPFAKNDAELKEYWRKALKYDVLSRIYSMMKDQDKEEGEEGERKKTFEELEVEARKEVLKNFTDWYDRVAKERRADHLSDYLNAITSTYDPHTNYFLPKDKENFDISMSGTLEGIGARLQTEGQYTKVSSIVPGGPAWKGKTLEVDDRIFMVGQGEEEPVDVTGLRIDDVVKLIRGKKGTKVKLTVKKIDGDTEVITITRDVVLLDEGYAKSALLNMPSVADNVGYIRLPRFYADFNRRGGRSCATDVAREIQKLNTHGVDEIILDLRNNGGGSLRDVVRMSGLFIEEGPIVQVKARGMDPDILSDTDPRVQFDGKLIVLVNSYSASASEILAAALQDYDRAVIVGTGRSTFGKGTVQRFFDLDNALRGNSDIKPLGEVKLTIQKFYRVDGGSTQLRGVTPDVILPDRFFELETGEQEEEYAMPWTEIAPVRYKQNVYEVKNRKELAKNSAARVQNNGTFKMIAEDAKRLKSQRDDTVFSLDYDGYKGHREKRQAAADKYKDLMKEIESFKIENLPEDLEDINSDESKVARNDEWIKNLKKDVYLEEALHILADMK